MPELPDIEAYCAALRPRVTGQALERVRFASPFVLRTVQPQPGAFEGKIALGVRRVGKRIAFEFPDHLFLVIHLMIAGRLHWKAKGAKPGVAAIDFAGGTLVLTEAGTKRRASIHLIQGEDALRELDAGGIDVMMASRDGFVEALTRENHTLKRALTDPSLVSGIGNAYSDEILHAARLSPLAQTGKLDAAEWDLLHRATQETMGMWIERLRGEGFPAKVTAFRPDMAVHGKFGKPCPRCGSPVQRIRYADNETNYCPECQTGGWILADRGLSRLLGKDWPRTLEELEALKRR